MKPMKSWVLFGATIGFLLSAAMANAQTVPLQGTSELLRLAQVESQPSTTVDPQAALPAEQEPEEELDPVEVAEKAVEDARAALRHEMAFGGDVRGARRNLQKALKELKKVRKAAEGKPKKKKKKKKKENGETETAETSQPENLPVVLPELVDPLPPAIPLPTAPAPQPQAPTIVIPAIPPVEPPSVALPIPQVLAPPQETVILTPQPPIEDDEGEDKEGKKKKKGKKGKKSAKADEPTLPIFTELPPVEGPSVIATAPAEEEIAKDDDKKRVIVRKGGRIIIKHDDNDRFRRKGEEIRVERGRNGTTITTVTRRNGTEVVTVRNADGDILQRYRKKRNGEIEILIGERDRDGKPRRGRHSPGPKPDRGFDFFMTLPKLVVPIPQQQYIVGSQSASRSQIEQALIAPPVERIERSYSLMEIRQSERLRSKLRRIDVDTVTFEFGAATIAQDQIPSLQTIGNALASIIAVNPNEVFLIEGHTDAVGSNLANLALSDRRAETIASILTFYFNIPPENLITQGYGEQYLKVLTAGPERANRRASVRRITPLLVGQL